MLYLAGRHLLFATVLLVFREQSAVVKGAAVLVLRLIVVGVGRKILKVLCGLMLMWLVTTS